MKTSALLDSTFPESEIFQQNQIQELNKILDLFDTIIKNGTRIEYSDNIYSTPIDHTTFDEWIFSKSTDNPQLSDLKRELSLKFEKFLIINNEQYNSKLSDIINTQFSEQLYFFISYNKKNDFFISSISDYFQALVLYIKQYTNKENFIDDCIIAFHNLYFHENVSHSLNTLNVKFKDEKSLIIDHLNALNCSFKKILKEETGYQQICKAFECNTGIECSPQSNRKNTEHLYYNFINDEGLEENLCCELHTKLKWKYMDIDKQDRIYFHPGKDTIHNGKILIVHIGKHL